MPCFARDFDLQCVFNKSKSGLPEFFLVRQEFWAWKLYLEYICCPCLTTKSYLLFHEGIDQYSRILKCLATAVGYPMTESMSRFCTMSVDEARKRVHIQPT